MTIWTMNVLNMQEPNHPKKGKHNVCVFETCVKENLPSQYMMTPKPKWNGEFLVGLVVLRIMYGVLKESETYFWFWCILLDKE